MFTATRITKYLKHLPKLLPTTCKNCKISAAPNDNIFLYLQKNYTECYFFVVLSRFLTSFSFRCRSRIRLTARCRMKSCRLFCIRKGFWIDISQVQQVNNKMKQNMKLILHAYFKFTGAQLFKVSEYEAMPVSRANYHFWSSFKILLYNWLKFFETCWRNQKGCPESIHVCASYTHGNVGIKYTFHTPIERSQMYNKHNNFSIEIRNFNYGTFK